MSALLRGVFWSNRTSPKGAFTIVQWDYRPWVDDDEKANGDYAGAFALHIRLHPNENRWHLHRSLRAAPSRWSAQRRVVVATVEEMLDPKATVRCFVVDAYSSRPQGEPPGCLTLHSAAGFRQIQRSAFVTRSDDVPKASIWLVLPVTNHRPPTALWGRLNESFDADAALTGRWAHRSAEKAHSFEQKVQQTVKSSRHDAVGLWALLGPGILLVAWFMFGPAFGINVFVARSIGDVFHIGSDQVDRFFRSGSRSSAFAILLYSSVYVWFATYALIHVCVESLRARLWCRREGQLRAIPRIVNTETPAHSVGHEHPGLAPVGAVWKGGTRESLVAAAQLSRGNPFG